MKKGHTVRNVLISIVLIGLLVGAVSGGDGETSGTEIESDDESETQDAENQHADDESSTEESEAPVEAEPDNEDADRDEAPLEDDSTDEGDEDTNGEPLTPEFFETTLPTVFDGEVVSYEESDGVGELVVVSHAQGDTGALAAEMGQVAGGYAGYAAHPENPPEDPPDRLEVIVADQTGQEVGEYRVETEWAEQYQAGELTNEEYSELVLGTVEVYD